jgi:tetratricopeptide (TPR) repeat protein/cellulose synthase/poly-beta-1,6-N-acetylglucosamine synthase-like glycosyltransferase
MIQQRTRQLIILCSLAVCLSYLGYRLLFTLNLTTAYAAFVSIFLLAGEAYGVFVLVLCFLQVWDSREPPQQPVLEGRTVDVFVPTYNEDPQLLRATLEACQRLDYPHRTYLCDDGGTEARLNNPAHADSARARAELLKSICAELGANYVTRPKNEHAKAGNLNYAFARTDGEFIIILDADHVPEPHLITRLIGYFRDEKLGFVQTPHAFYNFNNFQARLDHKNRRYWEEGHLFYEVIQPGRNRWNCPIFAGSAAMFRRKALAEVGYIATETITEDMHTGMRVNARGWKSMAISERLVAGQAAPDITTFHSQRIRWGEGNLSIMAHDNPLTMRGLTLPQRFCYLGSMVHWAGGLFKMSIYLTPLLMMFTGVPPVAEFTWTLAAFTLLYLIASIYGVQVASNGFGSFFNGELFCMINFWTQVQGTMKALFWRKFQQFVVTSKRGRQAKTIWPYIRPHLVLMAVSVLALVWGWARVAWGISDDYFKPIIPTFWILFHVALAGVVVRRAFWPEDRRFSTRHFVHLPVSYEARGSAGASGLGVTVDLNEIGVGLVGYERLAVDDAVAVTLWGRGESVECSGEVRNVKELAPGGFRCGIAFKDLSPAQTDALNRMTLHYAVPRLYAEYAEGRERTLVRRLGHWLAQGVIQRRFARRREARLHLVLDPEGRRGRPVHAVTEEVSRLGASALLAEGLAPDTEVDFLLATPLGEVRGRARVVRKQPRTYAARPYHLCAFEFLDFAEQGRVVLSTVLNDRDTPHLGPVLGPDREPLRIPMRRPLAAGLAACVPLVLASLVCFRVVYRDEFFLRDIAAADRPISEEELARVEDIFTRTMQSNYPSNDRLVLLMAALARVNHPREMDQVTLLLAPRDRRNLDLQFALAQTLDNHQDSQRAEDEYARLLGEVDAGRLPGRRKRELLLAAARASVHSGNVERAGELFSRLLRTDGQDGTVRNEFAGVLMGARRFADAARLYDGVQPDLNGRLLLVAIHAQAGDLEAAEKEARAIIRLRPDDGQAKLLLADVLSWKKSGYRQSRAIYEQLLQANAKDPDLLVRLAHISLWGQNYGEALERFQALIEGRLDNAEIVHGYVDAAASADKLGDAQRRTALAIYERALTGSGNDPVFLARLAWVLQRVEEPDKSAVLLDRAAALNPQDPAVLKQMFGAFVAAGRWSEALKEFEGKELDYDTRLLLVNMHLKNNDFEGAAVECRRLMERRPGDPKALRLLADILSWKKDYKGALELLDQLARANPNDPDLPVRQAEVTLWSGTYDDALARFQALLDAKFERKELWPGYAAAASSARELTEVHRRNILRIVERVTAEEPRDGSFLGRLAWVLYRLKDTERAGALADRAANLPPQEPAARKELAGVLAALGRTKPALKLYDGLPLDPDDHYRLAVLYAADRDFGSAEQHCRAVLKDRPEDAKALRQLADVLSWKKDYPQALALFERLFRADPGNAELPLRIAQVLLWKGDYDQALARFQALLEAKFDHPELWGDFIDAAASAHTLNAAQARLALRIAEATPAAQGKAVARLTRLAWVLSRVKEADKARVLLDRALALRPQEPAARKELAGVLAAVGRNRDALKLYVGLPLGPEDHRRLAALYAAEQDFAAAERECRDVLKEQPDDAEALRLLADVLSWKKDYPAALALLEQLARAAPDDPQLQRRLAEVTLWSGAYGDALTRYAALLEVPFDQPELWQGFADAAAGSQRLTPAQARLAVRITDRVLEGEAKDGVFLTRLAWVLHREKEAGRAGALLDRAVALRPEEPAARKELAGVLAAAGKAQAALVLYGTLLEARFDQPELWRGFTDAAAGAPRLTPEQTRLATRVADSLLSGGAKDAVILTRLAWVLHRENEKEKAGALLDRAVALRPKEPAARKELAGVLAAAGRNKEALCLYDGLPLGPDDHRRLASLYAAEQDFAAAEQECRAVLKELPEDPEALRQLADVLSWKKDYPAALALLDRLARAAPGDRRLQTRLAEVTLWSGAHSQALARYSALLAARFDQPELWRGFADAAAGVPRLTPEQTRLAVRITDGVLGGEAKDGVFLTRLAWVLHREKEAGRAGALLDRAVALRPEEPAARKELAGVLAAAGKTKAALHLYEGLPLTPEDRQSLVALYAAEQDFAAAERECRALLKDRPDDRKTLRLLAAVLTWKKDYAEALSLLKKLAAADGTDAELPLRMAELLLWSGDYDTALERFQGLLEANFEQRELWHSFVDAAASAHKVTEGQTALAVRIYEHTPADTKDAAFLARLAWLLYRGRELAKASTLLDRAVALHPQEPGVRRDLAGTLASVGKLRDSLRMYEGLALDLDDRYHLVGIYGSALLKYRERLDEDPDDQDARRQSEYVLGWKKVVRESVLLLQKRAGEVPGDRQLQVRAAEVTLWSGVYEEAVRRFQALLEEQFDQPELWRCFLDAAASSEAKFTSPQAKLIERIHDRLAAAETKVEYLSRLAWVLHRLKQTPKVEKLLDRALALRPTEPGVRRELAGVLAAAGRYEEARRLYDGLKRTFADHYRLAELDVAAHQFDAAEKEVGEILRARPEDVRAQMLLAAILSGTKRYEEASRLYRKLQQDHPGDPAIPVKLAELALWGGEYDGALAQFQALLDRDADQPELWKAYVDAAASATKLPGTLRATVLHVYEETRAAKGTDSIFLTRLAWVLRRVKEPGKSAVLLEEALAREPGSRDIRRQLAETLHEKGDYDAAEKHYRILLQPAPSPR